MTKKILVSIAVAALALMAIPSAAGAAGHTVTLTATLSGANEVPAGSGDPDGSGTITVTLNDDDEEICWDLTTTGLGMIAAMHIHTGAAGANGGVAVNFDYATNGAMGCVAVPLATIEMIEDAPDQFYINVHTDEFPAGAIRGQLAAPVVVPQPTVAPAPAPVAPTDTSGLPPVQPADGFEGIEDNRYSTDDAFGGDTVEAAPAAVAGAGGASGGASLAITGSNSATMLLFGLVLVSAGGIAVVAGRRRLSA